MRLFVNWCFLKLCELLPWGPSDLESKPGFGELLDRIVLPLDFLFHLPPAGNSSPFMIEYLEACSR